MFGQYFKIAAALSLILLVGLGCDRQGLSDQQSDMNTLDSNDQFSMDITDLSVLELQNTPNLPSEITVSEIRESGPLKDGIPSIDEPKFDSIEVVDEYLKDEGLGILVSVGEEMRYYPFQILVWHEVVNDTIGDIPIMITYCPLCRTGIVFRRDYNGEPVEFGVSGKLYRNNLLMYNRSGGPESLWSQAGGRAVVGALTGQELKIFPSLHVRWKDIKKQYKDDGLKVLSSDTGSRKNYLFDPYMDYYTSEGTLFPQDIRDERLLEKEPVFAIIVDGIAKAYPIEQAKEATPFRDKIGKVSVIVERDEVLNSLKIVTSTGGNILPASESFWFSWVATHPNTELWEP
jgi:hypothetical protein